MRVRSVDNLNDWVFGQGRNSYKSDRQAVAQSIKTRLQSFLGDCFFDLGAGVDWFNLLGSKLELELRLSITTIILNTQDVSSLREILVSRGSDRRILISYEAETIYGTIRGEVEQDA